MKFKLIVIFFCLIPALAWTQTSSLYVRGTGLNYNATRQVKLNDTYLLNGWGRGLALTIIDAATHAHVSSTVYDTFGSTTASDNLAIALNGLLRGQIGILTSCDAWEGNVTQGLRQAAQRLGLYKLAGGIGVGYSRRPYAAIFRGSGTPTDTAVPNHIAYEVMQSDDADSERAVIATMLINDAFIGNNLGNALVAGNGSVTGAPLMVNFQGNVGIGTSSPINLLHLEKDVNGDNTFRIRNTNAGTDASTIIRLNNNLSTSSASHALLFLNSSQRTNDGGVNTLTLRNNIGDTQIQSQGSVGLRIKATTGNVGIGTSNPDSKLTVKGAIHAEEVKVDLSVPGPDYVFEEDYPLASLEETKAYIDQHKHLPGIPSSAEMQLNGVNLLEMNMKLLEKVEELTLHLIELKEENKKQQEQLDTLLNTKDK